MNYFAHQQSIVRRIWGNGDTILLIFAGASAEFALNKAVDWLYFTGKLPADPLKRLFSTVAYARQIVFAEYDEALRAIDKIAAIHKGVEQARGRDIPDWAYRDVLYMLMDYSIRSFELLERKLTPLEKEDLYDVFLRMGTRMGVKSLPQTYREWLPVRAAALQQNMLHGPFTEDLYRQYRKHLGWFRFFVLKEAQSLLVPKRVKDLLDMGPNLLALPMVWAYKLSARVGLKAALKNAILPAAYQQEVLSLDQHTHATKAPGKTRCPFSAAKSFLTIRQNRTQAA